MNKYLIVVEKTNTGFSAFSPDVTGCVATGKTKSEVEENMREALEFHIEGLDLEGYAVPKPQSYSQYVDVRSRRLAASPARKTTRVLRRSAVRTA
jgi:predicted RNase H-like HicB family nuclease